MSPQKHRKSMKDLKFEIWNWRAYEKVEIRAVTLYLKILFRLVAIRSAACGQPKSRWILGKGSRKPIRLFIRLTIFPKSDRFAYVQNLIHQKDVYIGLVCHSIRFFWGIYSFERFDWFSNVSRYSKIILFLYLSK